MNKKQADALKHLREVVGNRNRAMEANALAIRRAIAGCRVAKVPPTEILKITEGREAKR